MEFTGKIIDGVFNNEGMLEVVIQINETKAFMQKSSSIKDCEKLSIKIDKYRKKRSTDANALLWSCLGKIAEAINDDKWNVYLRMLKRYGKFTYIIVKENAVEATMKLWRESEVVGDIKVNGQNAVQMICYYGSSQLNTKEFSVLLEGIISEMREMELETPLSNELKAILESREL